MKALSVRRIGASVSLFLGIIAVGAWPSTRIALGFSAGYCALANLVIERVTFGERGHARLDALPTINRRDSDNVTSDTILSLPVDGYRGTIPLGISLRRDVYLPLLIVAALIVAFPLRVRQRLTCLALAGLVTLAAGTAANALVVAWTFSVELKGIYPTGTGATAIRNFAYGALLLPPGNRFVAPLALGVGLIAWVLRPRRALRGRAATRDVAPAADRREGGRARDDQENRPRDDPASVAGPAP